MSPDASIKTPSADWNCSALASPAAGFALYTADVNGALTLIRSALLTWHRPFALGDRRLTGYASTLLLVVVMVLLQVLLGQLLFAPLLSVGLVVAHAAAEALTDARVELMK